MKYRCFCPDLSKDEFKALDLNELNLTGRTFYVAKTPMVSHFPVNPEHKIEKTIKEIEKKGYQTVSPLFVMFEDGLLMGSVLIEIVKPAVEDSSLRTFGPVQLVGRSYTGPKFLVPKALREFDRDLMNQNILTSDFYFWYHSCKECEKIKGSRTIILGKVVQDSPVIT